MVGARSNVEVEFQAMPQEICEVLWIKGLLKGFKLKPETPTKNYCDNEVVINIAHNPIQHDHTKHVKMDRHFMKVKN